MKRIDLLLLVFVVLFLGCGDKPVIGTVAGHKFEPAHTTTSFQVVSVGETTTVVPITTNHPARYYLWVQNEDGDMRKTECTEQEYESFKVGDKYGKSK